MTSLSAGLMSRFAATSIDAISQRPDAGAGLRRFDYLEYFLEGVPRKFLTRVCYSLSDCIGKAITVEISRRSYILELALFSLLSKSIAPSSWCRLLKRLASFLSWLHLSLSCFRAFLAANIKGFYTWDGISDAFFAVRICRHVETPGCATRENESVNPVFLNDGLQKLNLSLRTIWIFFKLKDMGQSGKSEHSVWSRVPGSTGKIELGVRKEPASWGRDFIDEKHAWMRVRRCCSHLWWQWGRSQKDL